MNYETRKNDGRVTPLVKALYIISAVLMAICVYMIIVNIMYINSYAASYGMSVSDMLFDAIQYVITGSISYFVYGMLTFCAGKIIRLLQNGAVPAAGSVAGADDGGENTGSSDETAGIIKVSRETEEQDNENDETEEKTKEI